MLQSSKTVIEVRLCRQSTCNNKDVENRNDGRGTYTACPNILSLYTKLQSTSSDATFVECLDCLMFGVLHSTLANNINK